MTYATVETSFLDVVRLLDGFDDSNTSASKYDILSSPAANLQAVVTRPGSILAREVVAVPRRIRTLWAVDFTLFHAFDGEIDSTIDRIKTARDDLLAHLDKYPTLNGGTGVMDFLVNFADEPDYGNSGAGRSIWWQNFRASVEERTAITIAE